MNSIISMISLDYFIKDELFLKILIKYFYSMEPKIIKIKTIKSSNGDISIIDKENNLPFEIKRIFYVHNISQDSERGGHAHKTLEQFIWAINGILEVKAISHSMKKFNYIQKVHMKDYFYLQWYGLINLQEVKIAFIA